VPIATLAPPDEVIRKPRASRPPRHDNSVQMWDQYFSAPEQGTWSFSSLVHRARVSYHGNLFAERVETLGGPAASYLEIGVGTAETLKRLQRMTGARCVGIDKTDRACDLARANATNCQILSGDGLDLPFDDASFDVVYSLGVLEHFELEDQMRLLREHARVARNEVLLHLPALTPHMWTIMWLNRSILGRKGVWADDELFTTRLFRKKFPGLPFRSLFDWAAGAMTLWFAMKPADVLAWVPANCGFEHEVFA
jgi:SAM-dependent methyltransferase